MFFWHWTIHVIFYAKSVIFATLGFTSVKLRVAEPGDCSRDLYINKQKNSDWALADLVVIDKRLESIQNQELINIFKDYLLNGNLNLLNDIKAKDISTSFVNSKKSYKQIYNSELPVFNSINNDLVFRLDALNVDNSNNMTLNNDDSITNWYDLSENGIIGTSTSKAPKFKLSTENIPSIFFNDSRVNFGLVDNEITDYTYFIVFDVPDESYQNGNSSGRQWPIHFSNYFTTSTEHYLAPNFNSGLIQYHEVIPLTVHSRVRENVNLGNIIVGNINANYHPFFGNLYEILIFKGRLTTIEIKNIETYLTSKWINKNSNYLKHIV